MSCASPAAVVPATTLDVLVATLHRPQLLARALDSLMSSPPPEGLEAHVTIVQNDCSSATSGVIAEYQRRYPGRVSHLQERRGGKSVALNTGILNTSGDLIGIVDDDEEIGPSWYQAIFQAFQDNRVDFIGGPCLPRWGAVPPYWLPDSFGGVIGFADHGDEVLVFGREASGILMGGNAVIRRRVLQQLGSFVPWLGPSARQRLLSGEDEELYTRLLRSGAHGLYVPQLRIYHYVPPERLTKRYYRRWCFWQGVSRGLIERLRPSPVAHLGRVPRYLYGEAGRAVYRTARRFRAADASERFSTELVFWQLAGFLYGSYVRRREVR